MCNELDCMNKLKHFKLIPMQVLLDKNGKVVYKHNGYLSSSELSKQIVKKILKRDEGKGINRAYE